MYLSLIGALLTIALAGCRPAGSATAGSAGAQISYPANVQELGSGNSVKWSESATTDGWKLVNNTGGQSLGYSGNSTVRLIQYDGFAFKDLNRNGQLDAYEDWRLDANTRAAELVKQLPIDATLALMLHHSIMAINPDGSDALTMDMMTGEGDISFNAHIDLGLRTVLSFATSNPVRNQAQWNNTAQARAEAQDFGIPVNISSNPASFSGEPGNPALAATFDTKFVFELAKQQAKQYRALGITTLLGPQIDLATEPRWSRVSGTFGEDPALSRDMTEATISGLQSSYDASGGDLGWGRDSVIGMMKHFPGDGPGEGGREAHAAVGKFNVYPGNAFQTQLIPFVNGGLKLSSSTGEAAGVMTSYSIAYSSNGSLGELVGSAFSEYKINILRNTYHYDGLICTDWAVTWDPDAMMSTAWGVEDIPRAERMYKAILAGVDQLGSDSSVPLLKDAYAMLVAKEGEDAAKTRIQNSARRILRTFFEIGLFENPYVDTTKAEGITSGDAALALGYEAQLKSVVMLKNDGNVIKAAGNSGKPTVYIPMQYTPATPGGYGGLLPGTTAAWNLPIDGNLAREYFNVVTDTVGTPTGLVGADGRAALSERDIIRASAGALAACDYALVFVDSPAVASGDGFDAAAGSYVPIPLQYGPYTALSAGVRPTSISGDMVEIQSPSPYGIITSLGKENRSYYGQSATAANAKNLDAILYAAQAMPEGAPVIVAINASNPQVLSEFESQVDAMLLGFGINARAFLDVVTGAYEPSGLLPVQMPRNMETVEAQAEDVPRDMDCYVDAQGNTYDFAFGLNWSGVIQDERTRKYAVPALLTP